METFSTFTGPLWGEFTGHRWIPLTKASGEELLMSGDLRRHGAHYHVTVINLTNSKKCAPDSGLSCFVVVWYRSVLSVRMVALLGMEPSYNCPMDASETTQKIWVNDWHESNTNLWYSHNKTKQTTVIWDTEYTEFEATTDQVKCANKTLNSINPGPLAAKKYHITVTSHKRHGLSNPWQLDYLFDNVCVCVITTTKKTQKKTPRYGPFVSSKAIHRSRVDYLKNGGKPFYVITFSWRIARFSITAIWIISVHSDL